MTTLNSTKRIALFSSYFESKNIPDYIFYYLAELRPFVTFLVFMTTDDKVLCSDDVKKLKKYVDEVVQVENSGYDFGMWQKFLNRYNVTEQYDELCLLNDSCVCFGGLSPYFSWHDMSAADVTGMTLSNGMGRHLQSFFLCVKAKALENVVTYIRKLNLTNSSFGDVIKLGELGLSRNIQEYGGVIQGFFEMPELDKTDPMYSRSIDVIRSGVPLIKKKLLLSYSSSMIRHLLAKADTWHHRALIDEAQSHTQLSKSEFEQLFTWYNPRPLTAKEKFRLARLWLRNKITPFR